MLRDLIVNTGIAVDATFKADEAMKTGMAVVKNFADGTLDFASAETADGLCFVQKGRYPTGINAARTEFSDYDDNFNNVAANEKVVAYTYPAGSTFATDAFLATDAVTANVGKVFSAGTDGKMKKANATSGSEVGSVYKFLGTYSDNGHTLAKFYVLDAKAEN